MSIKKDLRAKKEKDECIYQILKTVKDFLPDFTIHESDLKKPSTNFVQKFYYQFLKEYEKILYNIKNELFKEDSIELVPNENIDEFALAAELRKITKELEMNAYYLNDIFEPQPIRTKYFITWFINYLVYLSSDNDYETELLERVDKAKSMQKLKDEKQSILKQLEDLNISLAIMEDDRKKALQGINGLTTEHNRILKERAAREFEHQKDLEYINKQKSDIQAYNQKITNLREELLKLEKKLTDEHKIDKLKSEICNIDKKIDEISTNISSMILSLEEQEKMKKHHEHCFEIIRKPDFNTDLTKMEIAIANLTDKLENIQREKQLLNKNETDIENKQKIVLNYKNIDSKLKESWSRLTNENETEIKKFEETLSSSKENVEKNVKLVESLNEEKLGIEEMIAVRLEDMAKLKTGVYEQYEKILKENAEAHSTFNDILIKAVRKFTEYYI